MLSLLSSFPPTEWSEEQFIKTPPFALENGSGKVFATATNRGTETILDVVAAYRADGNSRQAWAKVKGIAFLDDGKFRDTGLAPRKRDVDAIPLTGTGKTHYRSLDDSVN